MSELGYRAALLAVLAGAAILGKVVFRHTGLAVLVGVAAYPDGTAGQHPAPAREVTFSRDVAPIVFRNCTYCHRPGEVAPFPLTSYRDTRPWARSIKQAVATAPKVLLTPLKRLAEVNGPLQRGMAAADSVFELIDATPERTTGAAPEQIQPSPGERHHADHDHTASRPE